MTVPVQTVFNSYTSAGTSTFVYGFQILSASHLVVTLNGVPKTQGVDYAVTGVGVQAGGTITGLATVAGDAVILNRVVPLQRLTDYQQNGDLLAGTLNPDLDLIWQTLQQIDEKANRALALPIGTLASATLPVPVPDTFLGWDSLGAAIQNYAGVAAVAVSTFMATVLAATTAAAARLLLGVAPRATRIDVPSVAGIVDLTTNAPDTDDIRLTGALAVTGVNGAVGRVVRCVAAGAMSMVNGAGLVTNTGANIQCVAGSSWQWRFTAANVVEVLNYAVPAIGASITNSLSGNISLNNTANFFDGPSCAQGTAGTWLATGQVNLVDAGAGATFTIRLWDGATVIASARLNTSAANVDQTVSVSGIISAPAGNIRISCKDGSSVNGIIRFNATGDSKDSTLTVVRIA